MNRKNERRDSDPLVASLIEGELAASETYRQALDQVGEEPGSGELRRIESEHRQAVCVLKERCRGHGPGTSGSWGAFARAVEGTAKLAGNEPAIRALIAGEEQGIRQYESALESEKVDPEIKRLISSTLLPQTRSHLPVLDRFLRLRGGLNP